MNLQKLFDLMKDEHGLTLNETELFDIVKDIETDKKVNQKEPTTKKQKTLKLMQTVLSDRLSKQGLIQSNEAWILLKPYVGYSTATNYFRQIMDEMSEIGKAEKKGFGKWLIIIE